MQNQSAGVHSNAPLNMHLTTSLSKFKTAEVMNQLMLRFVNIDKENEARLADLTQQYHEEQEKKGGEELLSYDEVI